MNTTWTFEPPNTYEVICGGYICYLDIINLHVRWHDSTSVHNLHREPHDGLWYAKDDYGIRRILSEWESAYETCYQDFILREVINGKD
jgi:hypothetical protein